MNMACNKQVVLSHIIVFLELRLTLTSNIQIHASRYSKCWFISLPVIEKAFLSCSHGNVCFEGYKSINPKRQSFFFFVFFCHPPPSSLHLRETKKKTNIPTMRNSRQPSLFVENHYTIWERIEYSVPRLASCYCTINNFCCCQRDNTKLGWRGAG